MRFTSSECVVLVYRWVLLETLDKVSPGIVNWKIANKPPIKLPFKKVENCNQVVKIGKQLKFSLVNIAGNDIVQGYKKLILGMLTLKLCFVAWFESIYLLKICQPLIHCSFVPSIKLFI